MQLRRMGAAPMVGTILGMHTVHEVVDLTNAWDYSVSQLSYAVNCARAAGWAPNYGYGEQDAASQWLDQWNDATAAYVVARTDAQKLYKLTTQGGNASGYSWDIDGAYVANSQGQSVDVWAEILNAVAPFDALDRQLRIKGNPTGFPAKCLPTYPNGPQPTAPDWDLDLYKSITKIPGFGPGEPWYRPLVLAGYIVAGAAVAAATVYAGSIVLPPLIRRM
jgi:hypothetical protein